ncbi:MAG: sulfate adenylyltransferase subunit CysD [Acidimicrobiales bacterium]|nr:sulfate adenylyltransferase subunit CysD [Acidimicrobiales bacterium]MDP6297831.1 sulfate adenylyltransferase subunit CysD [Acidimicrobiales bacterium]HJM29331.1 sulfate adenylyltransferase subunit CysD [Acidimicrobiales bacterium]HJM98484.1 sulfate adenylyltransferase subunit CysD [Acidimicrobiales bacterium]
MNYEVTHLDALESEAIYVMREVKAEFERPVLLCSGGKDSLVMVHIAQKAFSPCKLPFPIMHIDTGLNFPEVIDFRDKLEEKFNCRLLVASVQESIDKGRIKEEVGPTASRNRLQIVTLLDAIGENRFDAVFGGARRDEEKSRAKERFFSFRDEFGQWDPKAQRPELWNLYNGKHRQGEHFRIFPISNWTELDVWRYVERENIELPPIYYAHKRKVFERDGMLLAADHVQHSSEEEIFSAMVRYRTLGDANITGAVLSAATSIEQIINEVSSTRLTERGATRADDRVSDAAMEDRKVEGYF